jgi:hypothetical protein
MALALATVACSTPSEKRREAVYGPTESVLEIVAVLRRHVPDDTYRFPPASDFTGRNIYRSALIRLENIEVIHAEALRAGHMDAVIAFSKARALERLRAFDLASQHYRFVTQQEGALRAEAQRSMSVCDALAEAAAIGLDHIEPVATGSQLSLDPVLVVSDFDRRLEKLGVLLEDVKANGPAHYEAVVREEIERADQLRAEYFVAMRHALPDGAVRAVAELQRVVARHAPSKQRHQHVLALADLYADLAHEYVQAYPPASLRFDPPRFDELVDGAARLYRIVAGQDGTPEKLTAARRLEAFLAFTLEVDRDRFTR